MKTKHLITSFIVAGSLALSAKADLTVNFDIDGVRDATGAAFSPTSTLVLLVADFGNAGITVPDVGFSTAVGATWGSDVVFARFDLADGDGVRQISLSGIADTYAQKTFALYWFPTLDLADAVLLNGAAYGSSVPTTWATPAVGGLEGFSFFGQNNTGTLTDPVLPSGFSNARMTASSVVGSAVPEPSSFAAFAGLSVLAAVASRRRRSA